MEPRLKLFLKILAVSAFYFNMASHLKMK